MLVSIPRDSVKHSVSVSGCFGSFPWCSGWMGREKTLMAKAVFLCGFHHWSSQRDVEDGGSSFSKVNFV